MNREEADQDVVDEVSEEVDSRRKVMLQHSEKNDWSFFKEERVGGRARVTSDENLASIRAYVEFKITCTTTLRQVSSY